MSEPGPFQRERTRFNDSETWVARPVAARIHPSTRFVTTAGKLELDVRVELVDAFGDPIKYSADYRFEVWTGGLAGTAQSRAINITKQVKTYNEHQEHYDSVTRSYTWRLPISNEESALTRPRLHVYVTPEGQERIQIEVNLRGS